MSDEYQQDAIHLRVGEWVLASILWAAIITVACFGVRLLLGVLA